MSEPSPRIPGVSPMDRARYSANPGFKEGADESMPAAEQFLLAQPDVAEALEAVYVTGLYGIEADGPVSETPEAETAGAEGVAKIDPLNFELARTGLNRLRGEIREKPGRQTRERVIEAKARLNDMERSAEQEAERRRARAEQAEREKADREAAARAAEEAAAEQAREEARQAAYWAKLDQAVAAVHEKRPDLRFDGVYELTAELEIIEESREPSARAGEKRGFRTRLAERVAVYLEHPTELSNDIEALLLIGDWGVNETDEPAVVQYAETISAAVSRAIDGSVYTPQNLSPRIAREWLERMRPKQAASRKLFGRKKEESAEDPAATSFGKRILTRTMERTAREQPQQLLDVMHTIADGGFDAEDADMRAHAASFLSGYLYGDGLAANILFLSTVSRNPKVQRKAVDLYETLKLIAGNKDAVPHGQRLSRLGAEMDQTDLRVFAKSFLADIQREGVRGPGFADITSKLLDGLHEEYVEKFMATIDEDPESMSDTLYARVSAATE